VLVGVGADEELVCVTPAVAVTIARLHASGMIGPAQMGEGAESEKSGQHEDRDWEGVGKDPPIAADHEQLAAATERPEVTGAASSPSFRGGIVSYARILPVTLDIGPLFRTRSPCGPNAAIYAYASTQK